ncbi:MAG: DUF5820 family protein, partial [Haloplanus sp.]
RRADGWTITLFLEPEVDALVETADSREAGVAAARDLARAFADGDVDYRGAYQVPRADYFDRLDELIGREA